MLIITHLPQTASIPGRYYKIEKIISRGQTSSKAMLLDGRQQVENIAQMISGMSKSENAIRSALEMQKYYLMIDFSFCLYYDSYNLITDVIILFWGSK